MGTCDFITSGDQSAVNYGRLLSRRAMPFPLEKSFVTYCHSDGTLHASGLLADLHVKHQNTDMMNDSPFLVSVTAN